MNCEDFDPGNVDEQQQQDIFFFNAKDVFQASTDHRNNNTGQATLSPQTQL